MITETWLNFLLFGFAPTKKIVAALIAGRMKVHGFLAPQTNNKEKERKPTETHEETTRASSSQYAPKPT